MNRYWLGAFLWVAILAASSAHAGEGVSGKIKSMGCHTSDGVCFVTVEGVTFGQSLGCRVGVTDEFRFDNADAPAGKRAYASLLAAFLAGRSVSFYFECCSAQGWPLLHFFRIDQ